MNRPVICTIIAKNYLAQARCLTESFLTHHPEGRVFVLLVDRPDGYFDPEAEPFTVLPVEDVDIPDLEAMVFRYTLLELSTAVKPFFLQHLLRSCDYDTVCYFDPDIYFYERVDDIWEQLANFGIVLTPHLTGPLDHEHNPNEILILRSGVYNLGFIGISRRPQSLEFLDWWASRLTKYCVVDHDRGFFVDQRWVDLVPGRFPGVHVNRDPGCNVAYWNLYHREVTREGDRWTVNGKPLRFFHFSGYSPDCPDQLSKFQNRYDFDDLPHLRSLFDAYGQRLLANGYDRVKTWPNAYSTLSTGEVVIPDAARHLWRSFETEDPTWEPCVDTARPDFSSAILEWLDEPVDEKKPLITRLALAVHQQQEGLQARFPDVLGCDRVAYARWYVTSVEETYQFDPYFVAAIRASLDTDVGAKTRAYQVFTRWLFRIGVGQRLETLLGETLVGRIRDAFVQRGSGHNPAQSPQMERGSPRSVSTTSEQVGVNVIGYLSDETGVGESARATMRALSDESFPLAWTMVSSSHARQADRSVLHLPEGHPYGINLFYVNADQMTNVYQELGPSFFRGKYNIACWFWELERFPEAWMDRFSILDEIWVGSRFVQNTLAHVAPIPVVIMGVGIDLRSVLEITRADLGLAENRLVYLCVFDMLSVVQRKNPYGVIEAYRRAFGPDFGQTQLVIKVTKLEDYPEHRTRLQAAVSAVGGLLIDGYLDRVKLDALFASCDVYVSLHRSEGFGMTIAEAMCLGKPVIATDYGGNTDFMTVANSYPVAYSLVDLKQSYPPYEKGQFWAEPDLGHAAVQMREIFENYDEAKQKGRRAANDIQRLYGRQSMARRVIQRLQRVAAQS